uniref:Uncharacterized protein n=1 Tax=Anolis carolinensis TaxID=28377 RepID=A0A803TB00_ANOCA
MIPLRILKGIVGLGTFEGWHGEHTDGSWVWIEGGLAGEIVEGLQLEVGH